MQIWEFLFDGINQYSVLVHSEDGRNLGPIFDTNGQPTQWSVRPNVEPFIEKRKKIAKPRADISYLEFGTFIVNKKAYLALQGFLLPFGQFLELNCKGEIEYFFNVTNLIHRIDFERSEKRYDAVMKEVFLPNSIPVEPMLFKDPHTVRSRIYLNQAGKEKFEKIASDAGLFGARFVKAGKGLT